MHSLFSGRYRKIIEAVIIIIGLYFLLSIFFLISGPPSILIAIVGVFILYSAWVLPVADQHLSRVKNPSGPDNTDNGSEKYNKLAVPSFQTRLWKVLLFLSITVITFMVLHFFVLYMHEFSHSFTAYFLGAKADPLNIIWGNGLFGANCDENVDYQALFMAGKGTTAAAIAFGGPLSNILLFFVTAALLSFRSVQARPWVYHTVFWASGITFIMIFEYVFTRSFMTHDDFGNIEHGLGLSPYSIFIPGLILGLIGLWYIITFMVPGHYRIVTPRQLPLQYVTIVSVSFVFFLLYIGQRILSYPAVPEWWCGCAGIAALFIFPLLASPKRRWIQKKIGE